MQLRGYARLLSNVAIVAGLCTTATVALGQETPPDDASGERRSGPSASGADVQSVPPSDAAPATGAATRQASPAPAPSDSSAAPAEAVKPPEEEDEGMAKAAANAVSKALGNLRLRGYTQVRYNRLLNHFGVQNDEFVSDQGDRSIGGNNGFLIRRARLVIYGDVHPFVSVYLQPDFANVLGDTSHVALLRDWYADVFLTREKQFRFRIGQSKVPFGFENMQSSQNRLPFDRSDALNSALKDERDIGVFFYAETTEARQRFRELTELGLKGSGDYGVLGLGVFNGQNANRRDLNDGFHYVARLTWPWKLGEQYFETAIGGYTGRFVVKKDKGVAGPEEFADSRAHVSFVLYPQPFGIQAEYNVGVGPQHELTGTERTAEVVEAPLHGGYVLLSYRFDKVSVIPFARGVLYDGGKKFDTNAPRYHVREIEAGVEWQIIENIEVTGAYLVGTRTNPNPPYRQESGHVVRMQLQFNY